MWNQFARFARAKKQMENTNYFWVEEKRPERMITA